ncbi:hypothetical protein QYE76_047916 [Lolium multiflorum]|uniref:Integrase catalytic domain-containing protein n=1 Tax=Lolium multiflorum TaxID=4521 RepID=A0AAD8TST1_LOLMU|nr:hypothetical protein QYE76_047916 [Lolium multiflorum]
MGKPRDTKIAILPSTTRKGTTLSTSAALDSPSVISKLVSPPQASNAGTSAESENSSHNCDDASAVLDNDGSLGSFLDATIARSRQIENTETPNENAATPVNSPESIEYSSDDLDEDYVELDDDFIEKCNATTDARKIKKLLAEHVVRYKLSPDPKFATSPINIKDKDYDFSLDLSHIAIVEKTPFCGTEKESAVEHMTEKRTPDDAEELLAKIGRNHDDWSTPEPTPTPILKKRGMIKLNDEDMREAKKSLKEKGIKPEDVKNLPPIEDLCEITPPSSMIEDPLYPEGHPKRVEQDSQLTKTSAPSKKKKKKHKNVVESSEPVNDPNSISISDAETESGNEHDKDNDKDDTPDKEEIEKEPEKPAKNKKYTKEDFIAEKHGAVIDCNKGMVTFNVDDKEHTVYFPKRIDKTFPLRTKSDVASTLTAFYAYISTQFGRPIHALQTDNGEEFDNTTIRALLSSHDTIFHFTCPYTSQQNGRAKRILRTINDIVRTLLFHAHIPPSFWPDALATATLLINLRPCRSHWNYTPHHLLFGSPPSYDGLHIFGCRCYPSTAATALH